MSIRELSKSVLSFSWALSLLGVKQALSMVTPGGRTTGSILDPVTETTVGQLDETMKGVFRSGDNMQSKMMDMMFGMFNPANWNPMRWTGNCGRKAVDGFAQQASSGTAGTPPSCNVNAATAGSAAGWGPMPGDTSQL